MTLRRRLAIAPWPLALLIAGCTSVGPGTTGTVPTGVVTGVASPCVGPPMPQAHYEAIPVRVRLLKDGRVVDRQTVTGSHTFRFVAPPGRYVLRSDQSGTSPTHVGIASGKESRVNIYAACM